MPRPLTKILSPHNLRNDGEKRLAELPAHEMVDPVLAVGLVASTLSALGSLFIICNWVCCASMRIFFVRAPPAPH